MGVEESAEEEAAADALMKQLYAELRAEVEEAGLHHSPSDAPTPASSDGEEGDYQEDGKLLPRGERRQEHDLLLSDDEWQATLDTDWQRRRHEEEEEGWGEGVLGPAAGEGGRAGAEKGVQASEENPTEAMSDFFFGSDSDSDRDSDGAGDRGVTEGDALSLMRRSGAAGEREDQLQVVSPEEGEEDSEWDEEEAQAELLRLKDVPADQLTPRQLMR